MGLQQILFLSAVLACASAQYITCPTLFNFYPDSNDCSKFYRCVWGKAVAFYCPAGTRWSQHLLTCAHAATVACGHHYVADAPAPYQGDHHDNPHNNHPDFSADYNNAGYNAHPATHQQGYAGPSHVNHAGPSHVNHAASNNYHHTSPVVHPVNTYHPTAPASTAYPTHDNEPDYYQNVNDYRVNDYQPMNVYELPARGYNPSQNLFRAGYGYDKIYYRK